MSASYVFHVAYGKGTFIDAYGFKLCVEDAVIQHVKSNTGYDLPSPYTHKPGMEVERLPAAEEVKHTFKAFFKNTMAYARFCAMF